MSATEAASLTDCVLGHVDDPLGQVYDSRDMPRATAIGRFASDWGIDFKNVQCRTTYARWLTRVEPPDEWEPDEFVPAWTTCAKAHPDAIKVYICEERPTPASEPVRRTNKKRGCDA